MAEEKDKAPRTHQAVRDGKKKGLILVFTGEGKGKSAAAFGTILRAVGHGFKVALVQFMKGKWKVGEDEAFKKFPGQVRQFCFGEGFTWETKDRGKDLTLARQAWEKGKEVLADDIHRLVVLDEINYVMQYDFLSAAEVLESLKNKPAAKHVILTGDGAPPEIIELADLVTEMKPIKHPYQQGIKAQPGIEF